MNIPQHPKISHILHVDRLQSLIDCGRLCCDADVVKKALPGTIIGMNAIKKRRLTSPLSQYPDLHVGDCVPFYFCPRSVMLHVIYKANHPDLAYKGGQEPIIHLGANLKEAIEWAQQVGRRWAFTSSNAGSSYFKHFNDIQQLHEIDWDAINTNNWSGPKISPHIKEGKQAEFLMEKEFPWKLIKYIGVYGDRTFRKVEALLAKSEHIPRLGIKKDWYY